MTNKSRKYTSEFKHATLMFRIAGHIATRLALKKSTMETTRLFILATNVLSETLSM
ncbi:MAG: hypothetical protein Tsb005_21200 [Gammaproteobacteria bacterium]